MNRPHDGFIRLGASYSEHLGVDAFDFTGVLSHAAGDDHPAVFGQCLPDCLQRLLLGGVDEPTGVHHNNPGLGVVTDHLVPIDAQLGEDAFRVHQGFGAAEADESDFGCSHGSGGSSEGPGQGAQYTRVPPCFLG